MSKLVLGILLALQCFHIARIAGQIGGQQRASYESIDSCYWNIYNPCELMCMAGESDKLAEIVVEYYEKTRIHCNITGVHLQVGSGVQYPKRFTMPARWLETSQSVPIVALSVDCRNLNTIEPDAFNTEAFAQLSTLALSSITAPIMSKHSLRGLARLNALHITDFTAKALLPECLHEVRQTIVELQVLQLTNYDSVLRLEQALGLTALPALNRVRVYRNLGDSLAWNTFAGLVNVTHLDLSRCQITALGDGVFDAVAETLRELNLQLNLLTTLWPGVLDALVLRPWVRVAISNNRWQCDCDACYTKWLMRAARNLGLAGGQCENQPYRGLPVNETEFCAEDAECGTHVLCEKPEHAKQEFCVELAGQLPGESTTTAAAPTEAGNAVDEVDGDGLMYQQCLDYDRQPTYEIALRVRQYRMQLFYISQTTVAIHIESNVVDLEAAEVNRSGPNLVWFQGANLTNVEQRCLGCTQVQFDGEDHRIRRQQRRRVTVILISVQINIAYQFCVMHGNESSVSPFNCVPYVNVKRQTFDVVAENPPPVWLNQTDRSVSISMMVLAVFSSLLLGFCLGWIAQYWCRRQRDRGGQAGRNVESRKLETSFDTRRQSVCSTQSYAQPTLNLSRFDIVRRKLENRASENQYYLENMPEAVAPRPPSLQPDPDTSTTIAEDEIAENIYTDVVGSTYKRF